MSASLNSDSDQGGGGVVVWKPVFPDTWVVGFWIEAEYRETGDV